MIERRFYTRSYSAHLEGLRGVAVLLVIMFHALEVLDGLYVGVDIFFVLSGYLITRIILDECLVSRRFNFRRFYLRRLMRLWPALLAMVAAFCVYGYSAKLDSSYILKDALSAGLYFGNWTRALDLGYPRHLGHTWSLGIEEQYYLLWPVILVGLLILGRRTTSAVIAIGVLSCAAWRTFLFNHNDGPSRLYNGLDTRCDVLLIGSGLALLLGSFNDHKTSSLRAGVGSLGLMGLAMPQIFRLGWNSPAMQTLGFTIVALAAGCVIWALETGALPPLARALSNWPMVMTGRISYGLYLWHYPIFFALSLDMHLPRLITLGIGIPLTFAAAVLSYTSVEKPLLRWRDQALT